MSMIPQTQWKTNDLQAAAKNFDAAITALQQRVTKLELQSAVKVDPNAQTAGSQADPAAKPAPSVVPVPKV